MNFLHKAADRLDGKHMLKYMAEVNNSAILLKSDYQFKGPLAENLSGYPPPLRIPTHPYFAALINI